MSKGGSTKSTTSTGQTNPWGPAQPYLTGALDSLHGAYSKPPSYWGGPLTVGPTSAENAAWKDLNTYNSGYFGPGGEYGKATGANDQLLAGGPSAGYARAIAPGAIQGLNDLSGMGQYQLGQLGTAGSLDATSAIKGMLTGTPDYTGLQGSIDAANNPLMRQFNNEIIPGLNSKATFLNNSTGGIKSLGTIVPDLGQRMSENALALTSGERNRALAAQQYATGLVTQGGLTQDSQGLQARGEYANEKLGLGGQLGQYTAQANQAQEQGINNAPSLYSLGQQPADAAAAYAAWDRGLKTNDLNAQIDKFNYLRDQPKADAQAYAAGVLPFARAGGTTTGTDSSSTHNSIGIGDIAQGALGAYNAFGGGGLGSMFGGAGGGGGLGAAANAAGAAGITDMGGSAAGAMGALPGVDMGLGGVGTGTGATAYGMGAAAPAAAAGAPATAALGAYGAMDAGAAGGAAGSGLLPGSIAGANMADTAAYTPAFMEASTPGAGAGAGLGTTAGAIGAGGVMAGVTAAALLSQPYTVQRQYWNNLRTGITSGASGNATYDQNTPAAEQQYNSKVSLYNMIKQYGSGPMTHSLAGAGSNRIPGDIMQLAQQQGMVLPNGQINPNWNPGPNPFAARTAMQAQQNIKGGSGGSRIL